MNFQGKILNSIGKNAFLRFGGIIAQNLFFLITALLITRVFNSATLGQYVLAITVFNILGLAATLGLKYGTLRFVAFYRGREEEERVRGTIFSSAVIALTGGSVLGGALFIASPWLTKTVFHAPELTVSFRILAFGLPLLALSTIFISSIQGFKAIKEKVYLENIFQPLGALILTAVVFAVGFHLTAALASWTISVAVVCLLAGWMLQRIYPSLLSGSRPVYEIKSLLSFSFPLMGVGFLYYIFIRMDILMLGYFKSLSQVGIYTIAARLVVLVALPLDALNAIFEPTVAELSGRKTGRDLKNLYQVVTPWVLAAGFPIFMLLLIAAPPLLGLFGKNFLAGTMVLFILGVGQLVNIGVGSAGAILSMSGFPRYNFLNTFSMVIVNFILNCLLIPNYGIYGAALATSISISIINLLRLIEVKYLLQLLPFSRKYGRVLTTAALSGGGVWLLYRLLPGSPASPLRGLALVFLLALIYLPLLFVWVLDDRERSIFNNFKERWLNLK